MRKLIIIFFFLCQAICLNSQSIAGQAIFTQSQLDELDARIDTQSTDYWASGGGYFGDGLKMYQGSEQFLNQERGAGTYANEWGWAVSPYASGESTKEPRPGANPAGGSGASGSQDIEYIHDAAVLSIVWQGRSDILTFSGVTQTKDQHSKDLAEAVFEVIQRRASDANLDWSNRTTFPINGVIDANPFFIMFAKVSKYINSYACIYTQLSGTPNYALVENWLEDAVEYARLQIINKSIGVLGVSQPPFADGALANNVYNQPYVDTAPFGFNPEPTNQDYTFYDNAGVGVNRLTWAQAAGLNNRIWDALSSIGAYGTMFNAPTYRDFEKEWFKFFMEMGVFPDGTLNEWYRSYDGNPAQGLNYATITGFHIVSAAYRHAVAVENGLPGVGTNRGELFDYTTSRGTTELYGPGVYTGTSTSGGNKGLLNMLLNITNYYRTSANGGWSDLRFAEGGTPITEEDKPFYIMFAMANIYYDNPTLRSIYRGTDGFVPPNYYSNGFTIDSAGSWGENSYQPWGTPTSYGRFFGLGDMENKVLTSNNKAPWAFYNQIFLQ